MGQMTVLVTGAAGFVGRHCVTAARARGHQVVALVRRKTGLWQDDSGVSELVVDLSETCELPPVDAVIHAAASLSGGAQQMQRDTVQATQNLLSALQATPEPPRFILVSSLSVYGTVGLRSGDTLDETTPLETQPQMRDAYCRAKLAQEQAVRDSGLQGFLIRSGAVFGKNRLWNGHLGPAIGPVLLQIGKAGQVPLCYIDHCAQALVLAAETPVDGLEVLNLVDDDLPERQQFLAALRQTGWPRLVLPLPYGLLAMAAQALRWWPNRPGLLRGPTLRARLLPLAYDNARIKARLGWQPKVSFAQAMAAIT